jgi:hypothetical protein
VPIDLKAWHAAQAWLALEGKTSAHIPYANWLASKIPSKPIRIRRDFGRLLVLIETSALLFQAQRGKGPDERPVANVADYANAVTLAGVVFGESLLTMPARMLELVRNLDKIYQTKLEKKKTEDAEVYVTYQEVMTDTGLSKPYLSKQFKAAKDLGVLEDLREKSGGSVSRFVPHLEVVTKTKGLPTAEELLSEPSFAHLGVEQWVNPLTNAATFFSSIASSRNGGNGETPPSNENETCYPEGRQRQETLDADEDVFPGVAHDGDTADEFDFEDGVGVSFVSEQDEYDEKYTQDDFA